MSSKAKKNTKKSKTNSFDIMYRVVTAVLAAAVFPVVYFMNIVYYALDWTGIMGIINNLGNILSSENLMEGIKNFLTPSTQTTREISDGFISLSKLDELKQLIGSFSQGEVNYKELIFNNADFRPLLISLSLFAVVVILALVILIVAIVGKNKTRIISALSGIALVFGGASNLVFVTRFANPLINGDKTLSDLFQIESIAGSVFADVIGNVIELRFDNAFFTTLFLMGGILIWSLSVMIVNADDKEEKALREAKKAEKKAKKAAKVAKKEAKKAEKAAEKLENKDA